MTTASWLLLIVSSWLPRLLSPSTLLLGCWLVGCTGLPALFLRILLLLTLIDLLNYLITGISVAQPLGLRSVRMDPLLQQYTSGLNIWRLPSASFQEEQLSQVHLGYCFPHTESSGTVALSLVQLCWFYLPPSAYAIGGLCFKVPGLWH